LLKKELLAMVKEDQSTLQELHDNGELGTVEYHPKIKAIHEKNNKRIKQIISEHGWPGFDMVGKDGAEAAWLLTQHAVLDKKFMESCVSLLKEAVEKKQAQKHHLAFLQDRILTMSGQPQIYGTQFDVDDNGKVFPLPIKDTKNVDKRRREIGLESLSNRIAFMQEREDERRKNRKKGDNIYMAFNCQGKNDSYRSEPKNNE
jgi:hypothetical protein